MALRPEISTQLFRVGTFSGSWRLALHPTLVPRSSALVVVETVEVKHQG